MRKKLFTFLLALTASIGMMWAENPVVVTINKSEFTPSGVTKEGVTLAPSSDESASGSMTSSDVIAMVGSFEFSTSLGKFTRITIATDANIMRIYENGYTSAGWPTGENLGKSAAWTGESETVLISCEVAGMDTITITCTIEPTPVLVTANTLQLHVNDAAMGSVALQNPSNDIIDNGDGTYDVPEGAAVTLIATPNEGYEFIGWKASSSICDFNECEFVALSTKNNPLTVDMYQEAAFMAEFAAVAPQPEQEGDGKLTGAFTVNAGGDQVYFSQGNLQYQASTNTWRFAEHQYDFIGNAAGNNTESGRNTQSDWIDLFGWATSGNSASGTAYQPWQSSTTDSEYGPAITSGQWTYANSDWGINPISNGGNVANSWRTLTQEEWNYILNSRSTDYRFCYAKLNIGVQSYNGLIILPDDWDPSYYALSAGSMNQDNHNYNSNVISEEDWTNSLEAHGAVFLPASGIRTGNEVTGLDDDDKIGLYWSSIAAELHEVIDDPEEGTRNIDIVNAAYNLAFYGGYYIRANQVTTRSRGLAVRLVSETAPGGSTPTPTAAEEQVPTNADPENPSYHYSTFFHSTQNYALKNDGTTAFVADLSGSDLVLTEIANGTQVIPANTAVILRKTGSADPVVLTPTEENGVSFSAHNSLEGVDAITAVTSIDGLTTTNCYVLSGSVQHGVGFYRILGSELKAHKAYVKYAGLQTNAPKRMRFVFNTATGVDQVPSDQVQSTKELRDGQLIIIKNGVRYNAQGQIVK